VTLTMGCAPERAPTPPPEHTFLHRLLETGATESSTSADSISSVDAALAARKASTIKTLKALVQSIDVQRTKNEELANLLRERLSGDGRLFV
jgi:E3 ubiquitin-protein ligase BRE1